MLCYVHSLTAYWDETYCNNARYFIANPTYNLGGLYYQNNLGLWFMKYPSKGNVVWTLNIWVIKCFWWDPVLLMTRGRGWCLYYNTAPVRTGGSPSMEYLCTFIIFKWVQFHALVWILGSASKYSALHHPELKKCSAELCEGNWYQRVIQPISHVDDRPGGKNLHTIVQPGAVWLNY